MRTVAAAVAAALLAAGCSSWNPLVALGIRSEPAHKPTPLEPIQETVTPRVAWTASAGKAGAYTLRPAVEGDRTYVAAADGTVTTLATDSGRVEGRVETKKPLSGGVGWGGGKLLFGTAKGEVVALEPGGKVLWTSPVAGELLAAPTLARNTVVARTADGRIFGLAAEDGKRRWVYQRPAPALLLRTESGVLASGTDVVAGYPNGKLIALDLDDGKLTWEVTVSPPRGTTELERIADVAGLPLIDGPTVCAGAYQGKVACFEIQTRNMLWARDLSTSRSLARDAKRLYVTDDTSAVHALDRTSGASAWKQDKLAYRRLTEPVVLDGRILVGDGMGYLHVLAAEDGKLVGRLATDGSAILAIVPAAGGVIVQTANGQVSLVRL